MLRLKVYCRKAFCLVTLICGGYDSVIRSYSCIGGAVIIAEALRFMPPLPSQCDGSFYLFNCFLFTTLASDVDKNDVAKEARRKLKEERQRKKERKRNKKARVEKECITERMNCFRCD